MSDWWSADNIVRQPAAGAPGNNWWADDPISNKEKKSTAPTQQENTAAQSLARQLGLTARAAGPAAAGALMGGAMGGSLGPAGALGGAALGAVALPLSDAAVSAYNWASGSKRELPSQALDRAMTEYLGLPEPANATERTVLAANRAMLGAGASALTAHGVAAAAAPNTVSQGVANTLAANPVAQVGSSATGALASGTAHEMGAGPLTSTAFGLLAGAGPYAIRPENISGVARTFTGYQGDPGRARNIQILTDAGVPTTPAQRIGNPGASGVESVLRYLPTSAGRSAEVADAQQRAVSRHILRGAGIDSEVASPQVLEAAQRNFSRQYQNLERNIQIRADNDFVNDLRAVAANYAQGFGSEARSSFDAKMRDLLNFARIGINGQNMIGSAPNARIPGRNYQVMRDQLESAAAGAERQGGADAANFANAMRGMRDALDNVMERSAPPGVADAWRDVNQRYAAFSAIKDTMQKQGGGGADKLNTNFIPASQYGDVVRNRYPEQWVRDTGRDWIDFARAAKAIVPDPIPNSGTAQRSFVQNMITTPFTTIAKGASGSLAGGAAAGGAGAAHYFEPVSMTLGPYLAARAWYGQRLPADQLGILAAQSALGSEQRTPDGYPYIQK
jgi:hypothetical protein